MINRGGKSYFSRMGGRGTLLPPSYYFVWRLSISLSPPIIDSWLSFFSKIDLHYHTLFIYMVMSYDSKWTPNKSLWSDCIFLWLTSQSDLLPRFPPCELLHSPVSVTMTFYLNSSCVSAWWWLSSPPLHVWTSATLTTCCQLAQLHKLN